MFEEKTQCHHRRREGECIQIHFDPTLTWTNHIKITAAELRTKRGKIERALPFQTAETKKLLLNTLITPYIDYCSEIWSSPSNSNLARIERLYQRALSILSPGVESETSLRDRLHRNIAIMTFKSTNGLAPIYLPEKFTLVNQIHCRNTRSHDFKKIFVIQDLITDMKCALLKTELPRSGMTYQVTLHH